MTNTSAKIMYSVPEFVFTSGLCRSYVYQMMNSGEIESVKVGKRRLIPAESVHAWMEKVRGKTTTAQ